MHRMRLSPHRLRSNYQPLLGLRRIDQQTLARMRSTVGALQADPKTCVQHTTVKPFSDIPGPKYHWALRTIKLFMEKGGVLKAIYRDQERMIRDYGPLIKVVSAQKTDVMVAHPADVETVFQADPMYPKRSALVGINMFREKFNKESGVFFLDGEKWYKHRSVLSKRMLRPFEISKYIPRLNLIADEMVSRMEKIRNPATAEKPFEIDELDQELFHWSFESIGDILFDQRFGSISDNPPREAKDFINGIAQFLKNIVFVSVLPSFIFKYYEPPAYKNFSNGFLTMYYYAEKFIQDKLDELDEKLRKGTVCDEGGIQEFIPYLLASNKIKPEEIGSSIVDTLFAGVDTTSNTMQWMLYLLATNAKKQEILCKEVDKYTVPGQKLTSSDLSQMSYLKATIKETLRLYPVLIAHMRNLAQDVVLSGYQVPAGTNILILNHGMGRSPTLFDSPNEFRPERWLRGNNRSEIIPYSSTPFGHGVRMCLGRRLAEIELQLLVIKILQNYTLGYASDEVVEQYIRGTNIPDRPLRVTFQSRQR